MQLDPVVTATFATTLAAPLVARASIRRARQGDHVVHRRVQTWLLVWCWLTVLALELRIRLAGGSGSLVGDAPGARVLLVVHIAIAFVTYGTWTWLAVASRRRFGAQLPGSFSRRHKMTGRIVVGGMIATALTAVGMYVLVTVA